AGSGFHQIRLEYHGALLALVEHVDLVLRRLGPAREQHRRERREGNHPLHDQLPFFLMKDRSRAMVLIRAGAMAGRCGSTNKSQIACATTLLATSIIAWNIRVR